MLTEKKREYVRGRLSGLGLAEAYRRAYDCRGSSDATVRTEAYRLERDPDVSPMLTEGRSELAQRAKWSRDEAIDRLSSVLDTASAAMTEGDLSRSTTSAFFQAFDRICHLTGVDRQTSDLGVAMSELFRMT